MEIKLQSPLKVGTSTTGWHHQLVSVDDLKHCIYQGFGDHLIDYSSLGLIGHNGLDLELENGDEVFASHDGTATYSQDSMKGLGVVVTTDGYKTIYWHLKDATDHALNTSWPVKKGDLIGHGDNTGFSTGPHLHYGLKLLDNAGNVLNRDNGYDGAVDPLPYLVWWDMNPMVMLDGGKDIWLVRDGKRSLIYNVSAFQLLGGNVDLVQKLTQTQLDAIPDSGIALAGIVQE